MIKGILGFFSTVLLLSACDNDFDLVSEKEEIPVVYAILNAADTAQYFRVERAFIDETVSALVIAQDPDSLYYDNAIVTLTRLNTGDSWVMAEVDGNVEGYPRQEGVFATSPNILYKLKTADIVLEEEEEYRLTIDLGDDRPQIEATTTLLKPPFLASPADGSAGGGLEIDPSRKFDLQWGNSETSVINDAFVTFFYDETLNGQTVSKSIDWQLLKNDPQNEINTTGLGFYSLLAGALEENPSITRVPRSFSFTLISGSQEMSDYIRIGRANLGITSSGEIPVYEGSLNYGLGLFASRYTEVRDELMISGLTRDSLSASPLTIGLNFQ